MLVFNNNKLASNRQRSPIASYCTVLYKNNNNNKIIIIIMGLESVSASEDVIGDLPSPWATVNS